MDANETLRRASKALEDLPRQNEELQSTLERLTAENQTLNSRHTKAMQELSVLREKVQVCRGSVVICSRHASVGRCRHALIQGATQ